MSRPQLKFRIVTQNNRVKFIQHSEQFVDRDIFIDAIKANTTQSREAALTILKRENFNCNFVFIYQTFNRFTPLTYAIEYLNIDFVLQLLAAGADPYIS